MAATVLGFDPGCVVATQVLATALLGQERAAEAIAPLQMAIRRHPHPATETLLGLALARAGRQAEALKTLHLATTRRPPFVPAFLELGSQLRAAGRPDEAMAVFNEGLAVAPGAGALLLAAGNLHLQRNNRAQARRFFELAHTSEPGRTGGLVGLARVSSLEGDHAAAADCWRLALAVRPEDVMLQIELGKCLLEIGARDQGEATLQSAACSSPIAAAQCAVALAESPRGRLFLRTSKALEFLRGEAG